MRAKVPDACRKAATLVEVLVAMFVMAIGMVTLLALFPLGVLSMAQAIKDDRCALAAGNAAAIESAWDFRHGAPFLSGASPGTLNYAPYYNPTTSAYWAQDPNNATGNPNATVPPGAPSPLPKVPSGSGYPLYFDPVGLNNGAPFMLGAVSPSAANQPWSPGIQRVFQFTTSGANSHPIAANPLTATGASTALDWHTRWFTLLDDVTFENNGVPSPGDPGGGVGNQSIAREDRYSWAYVFRYLNCNPAAGPPPPIPAPDQVEESIVVYSGRPQLAAEQAFPAQWTNNNTTVTVNFAGLPKPAIRKGSWILDNTVIAPGGIVNANGFFYRVVNVTEFATTMDLELLTSGRRGNNNTPNAFIVVMDGVVEVFDKPVSPATVTPW
jgi:hypothetical protein